MAAVAYILIALVACCWEPPCQATRVTISSTIFQTQENVTSARREPEKLPVERVEHMDFWVAIKPALNATARTFHVQEQMPGWLKWSSGLVGKFVGDARFARGLSDELIPRIRDSLATAGIRASILAPEGGPIVTIFPNGEQFPAFLVTIDGIIREPFQHNYLKMVRDGIIAQLMGDGSRPLAEQLNDYGVPNAAVMAKKVLREPGGLIIQIGVRKGDLLKLAIAQKLGLDKPTHASNWLTAIVRALGVKDTKSTSIATEMNAQIKVAIQKQLMENGIESTVQTFAQYGLKPTVELASVMKDKKIGDKKPIIIIIHVNIVGLHEAKFAKAARVVLRDAVVEKLAGDDADSMEFQLAQANFPAESFFVKCGWSGPAPPIADRDIERDFREQVQGCDNCGVVGGRVWPSCNVFW